MIFGPENILRTFERYKLFEKSELEWFYMCIFCSETWAGNCKQKSQIETGKCVTAFNSLYEIYTISLVNGNIVFTHIADLSESLVSCVPTDNEFAYD